MKPVPAVVLALLVTTATLGVAVAGGVAGSASPSQEADSETYAGTHVAFETSGTALTDYRVGGDQLFESVAVDSQRNHESETGVGADIGLSAVTDLSGLGLELEAQTETRAAVRSEGSASLTAHDSERGILTVEAGEESQYVELALSSDATAATESGDRVVLETENRSGAFVVAGDGEVTVNDEGDVVADLESESTLVFRSYADGERDEDAQEQEEMIAEGTATAEVYVDERDGERVADVAYYGGDVAVDVASENHERLEMTAERAESEGTVLIASISETVLESGDDLEVAVDGEVATEASSYSELAGGIGGDDSRYMVVQGTDAAVAADVLIAVNHFSEREIAVQSAAADGDESDADETPGFGIGVALLALLVAAAARVRP